MKSETVERTSASSAAAACARNPHSTDNAQGNVVSIALLRNEFVIKLDREIAAKLIAQERLDAHQKQFSNSVGSERSTWESTRKVTCAHMHTQIHARTRAKRTHSRAHTHTHTGVAPKTGSGNCPVYTYINMYTFDTRVCARLHMYIHIHIHTYVYKAALLEKLDQKTKTHAHTHT